MVETSYKHIQRKEIYEINKMKGKSVVTKAIAKKTVNCSNTWALTKIDWFLKLLNNLTGQLQKVHDILEYGSRTCWSVIDNVNITMRQFYFIIHLSHLYCICIFASKCQCFTVNFRCGIWSLEFIRSLIIRQSKIFTGECHRNPKKRRDAASCSWHTWCHQFSEIMGRVVLDKTFVFNQHDCKLSISWTRWFPRWTCPEAELLYRYNEIMIRRLIKIGQIFNFIRHYTGSIIKQIKK